MHTIEKKIKEMGLDIPNIPDPIANYVPYKVYNKIITISGQAPIKNGKIIYKGKVGKDITIEEGIQASKLCAENILAIIKKACNNDWNNFGELIKLGGFVNCAKDFSDHPKIINGASDMLVEVLGSSGKRTRFAVGANSLPLDISVEIEALASLR